jgi:hypothetical protein
MYFYTMREVLPLLAILGASFVLFGALAAVGVVLWKAATPVLAGCQVLVSSLGTPAGQKRGRSAPAFAMTFIPNERSELSKRGPAERWF